MGVRSSGVLLSLLLIAGGLAAVVIGTTSAQERLFQDAVTLTGSHSGMQFLAGRSVRIDAEVDDDVFAAGRSVRFDGARMHNAITAGYTVAFERSTARDMIALAGVMDVAGEVQDDLVAAGRRLRIGKTGSVGGDARLAARSIELDGRIGGSVRAVARRITVSGLIEGKADFMAERIVIAPGARIAGDLIYRSERRPEIAEGASIGGTVQQIEPDFPTLRKIAWSLLGIGLAFALACALGVLLLGAAVQFVVPGLMDAAANRLQQEPWLMLGRGVALLLLLPLVAGLLLATLVGIPLGVVLLFSFFLFLALGLVAAAYSVGRWIGSGLGRPTAANMGGRILWTLAGLVVIGAISLVTFVGLIILLVAVSAGLAAVAAQVWNELRPEQAS
jgi:cytoskeletal protein CcmA (bactofilin family)